MTVRMVDIERSVPQNWATVAELDICIIICGWKDAHEMSIPRM
jgi:hypothetical protein